MIIPNRPTRPSRTPRTTRAITMAQQRARRRGERRTQKILREAIETKGDLLFRPENLPTGGKTQSVTLKGWGSLLNKSAFIKSASKQTAKKQSKAKAKYAGGGPSIVRELPKRDRRSSIMMKTQASGETGEPYVGRRSSVEVMNLIISPRGRTLTRGVVSPFERPPEDMPQSVQDYFLGSRAIRRMAYDPDRGILEIVFQTGYQYQFFGVPHNLWINFQQAPSKGRFFHNQIYGYWDGPKGSKTYHPYYSYRRIR